MPMPGLIARHVRRLTIVAALAPAAAPTAAAQPPLVLEPGRPIRMPEEAGNVIATTVAPDGHLVVASMSDDVILRLAPDGTVRQRIGRSGAGPGEFGTLYRVAVAADGGILAYQLDGHVSWFAPDGRFLRRKRFPMLFRQVDDLLPLPDGRVVISGVTTAHRGAREHGIHVFDDTLGWQRSFGGLPPVRDPRVREFWGAGRLRFAGDGTLLYVPRVPFDIHRFSVGGRALGVIRSPRHTDRFPDEEIRFSDSAGWSMVRSTGVRVPKPIMAFSLPSGHVVSGVVWYDGRPPALDLYTAGGDYLGETPLPWIVAHVAGWDPARQVLWLSRDEEDGELLVPVKLSLAPALRAPATARPASFVH